MENVKRQAQALRQTIQQLDSSTVEKPTLMYFKIIGIGWPIRCLLHLAGVDYELVTVEPGTWFYPDESGTPMVKHSVRNTHLPIYVDVEANLNDSRLILEYLADKHGLMPGNKQGRYAAMEVLGHGYDALFGLRGMLPVVFKLDMPEEVVAKRLDGFMGVSSWGLFTDGYNINLGIYESLLSANSSNSGFMVGESLSVADLHAFNVLCNWYKAFDPERFVTGFPALDTYIRQIAGIPGVRDYIDNLQERSTWFEWPNAGIRLVSPEELTNLV